MITLQRTPTVPLGKVRLSLMMLLRNKKECDNDTYVMNIKDIEHFANESHNLVIIANLTVIWLWTNISAKWLQSACWWCLMYRANVWPALPDWTTNGRQQAVIELVILLEEDKFKQRFTFVLCRENCVCHDCLDRWNKDINLLCPFLYIADATRSTMRLSM